MNNLEGIRLTEIPEEKLEKTSMKVNEHVNPDGFSDCELTEREKLGI